MNEAIDLYLLGEHDAPSVPYVSDNEYYFIDSKYFDCEDTKLHQCKG